MNIALALIALVIIVLAVRFFLRRRNRGDSGKGLTALVLLMSQPRLLTEQEVRDAISKVWGLDDLGSEPQQTGNWIVEGSKVMPAMARPNTKNYLVSANGKMFLINSVGAPYVDNPEEFSKTIPDLRLRAAVANHCAWNSVDLFGPSPDESEKAEVYALIGQLLAEFANDNCLAIYCPSVGRCNEYAPAALEALKSGRPLVFFDEPTHSPIVAIKNDDPRMIAAVAEAKQRWPEFVAAFDRRTSPEQMFVIKARFAEGEDEEFMWAMVDGIESNCIKGRLGNAPAALTSIKEGDPVVVPLDDLNDWMYESDGQPVGGFTMKVMAEAMKK